MSPQRIQLRRTKGWRKPERTIVVSRPSKWGNPFRHLHLRAGSHPCDQGWLTVEDVRRELAGRDLACWCPVLRPAPLLAPAEQAPALRTLAAWVHWRNRDLTEKARRLEKDNERQRRAIQELRVYDTSRRCDPNREVIQKIVNGLGGGWGDEVGDWKEQVHVDDVIAVLEDLGAAYERRDDAARIFAATCEQLEILGGHIAHILKATDPVRVGQGA